MKVLSILPNLGLAFLLAATGTTLAGCADHTSSLGDPAETGSVGLSLFADGVSLTSINYTITGPNAFSKAGTINVAASPILSAVIGGLPVGTGFSIALTATATDGVTTCAGSGAFDVVAGSVGMVTVTLDCHQPARTGSVVVNGVVNICPVGDGISADPADVAVGFPVALAAGAHDADGGPFALSYTWTASSGSLSSTTTATPTFVCSTPGPVTITATVSDGDLNPGCAATMSVIINCEASTVTAPDFTASVVVSSFDHYTYAGGNGLTTLEDVRHGVPHPLAAGTWQNIVVEYAAPAGNHFVLHANGSSDVILYSRIGWNFAGPRPAAQQPFAFAVEGLTAGSCSFTPSADTNVGWLANGGFLIEVALRCADGTAFTGLRIDASTGGASTSGAAGEFVLTAQSENTPAAEIVDAPMITVE